MHIMEKVMIHRKEKKNLWVRYMIFTIEIMNAINTIKVIQQVEKFFFFEWTMGKHHL